MRVCTQCGKEGIGHLPRVIDGHIPCPHEYEDIIAGLKDALRAANLRVNEAQHLRVGHYKDKIRRRNQQIKTLMRQQKEDAGR